MLLYPKTTALAIATVAAQSANGFSVVPSSTTSKFVSRIHTVGSAGGVNSFSSISSQLYTSTEDQANQDDEIKRLRQMASNLRAEVALLEAERQEELSKATEKAFQKFDINKDGQISLAELKSGLERELKLELPEQRVKQLMKDFDTTGDGTLQLDEFVTVEQFRNRLESLAGEERRLAKEAALAAKREEEAAKFLEAQLELINDNAPTLKDRVLSTLPYLFPLLDSVQFGRFLLLDNADNIFAGIIAVLYALYRSVPFGGLICFFALSFLSGNPSINKLIRFNMQQAIFLDIALFVPGLIGALFSILFSSVVAIPPEVTVLGNSAVFFTLAITCVYTITSSLLGITPDKIPGISDAVAQRMPTFEVMDLDTFKKNLENQNQNREKKDKDDKDK